MLILLQLAQDEMEMLEEDGKHHQHNQLDWDDTPLTITVNPMQNWVDEDETQGIEYLMGKGAAGGSASKQRGMSKLGGPTLHLSGAGHLEDEEEEEEDELDTSSEEESDQDLDSDEDSADSGEDSEQDEINECIEARTYSSRGGGSHSSSNSSGSAKKGGKRGSRGGAHQLEWDSTI